MNRKSSGKERLMNPYEIYLAKKGKKINCTKIRLKNTYMMKFTYMYLIFF